MNKARKDKREKLPKSLKKLKPFFDEKKDAARRLKAIVAFLTDGVEEEEATKFVRGQQTQIHSVLVECFGAYESNCKKGKHDLKELQAIILVLRALIVHLQDAIAEGWQTRSLLKLVEKLLYKENKIEVKESGFQLLLHMCEAMGTPETNMLELIPAAVNLNAFGIDYAGEIHRGAWNRVTEAPEKSDVLVPGGEGKLEDSVGLLNILFDFMSTLQSGPRFAYWYEQFKNLFLYIFYPSLHPQAQPASPIGFWPTCPRAFQDALVDRLAHWTRDPEKCTVLAGSKENMNILWHLYKHGIRSLAEFDIVRKFIHVYKSLCWPHSAPMEEIKANIIEYRKQFVQGLLPLFEKESSPDDPSSFEGHVSVCKEIFGFFRHQIEKATQTHDLELKHVLMTTLLNTVCQLCSRTDASSLVDRLCGNAVGTVLFCWVRSNVEDDLWKTLQEGLSSLFSGRHGLQVLQHARDKLVELTLYMRPLIYPEARKSATKKKRHNPDGDSPGDIGAESSFISERASISLSSEASREIALGGAGQQETSGLPQSAQALIPIWHNVLNIFAGVNNMKSPELQAAGIGVITTVADMLLIAEMEALYSALTDSSRPRPLQLIDIFGPWLFAACQLSDAFAPGKALAYGTLCRLICRQMEAPPGGWLLGHFYYLLRDGLSEREDMRCVYAILLNSSPIFSLALDGASILIPHYLMAIKHLITKGASCTPPPDNDVKQRALSILCSLISVTSHLNGLDITSNSGSYTMAQARSEVAEILLLALANENTDELKVMSVWGICVLLFDELSRSRPEQAAITKWLEDLLLALTTHDSSHSVLQALVDAISSLSLASDRLVSLSPSFVTMVLSSLSARALDQISAITQGRAKPSAEAGIVREVECIVDWIMMAASNQIFPLLTDVGLLRQVYGLLDAGMGAGHGSPLIHDAAEAALYKLVNHTGNFPPRSGIAVLTSQLSETDDLPTWTAASDLSKQLFFLYNNSSLLSLVQLPPSSPSFEHHQEDGMQATGMAERSCVSRLILRDSTGKYAWDASPAYKPSSLCVPAASHTCLPSTVDSSAVASTLKELAKPTTTPIDSSNSPPSIAGGPPKWDSAHPQKDADQLHHLLQYLSNSFAECKSQRVALDEHAGETKDELQRACEEVAVQLEAQISNETSRVATDTPSLAAAPRPLPQTKPNSSVAAQPARLLSHLGYLPTGALMEEERSGARFNRLENSDKFRRSVSQLDKSAERELQKIGVIYVKHGQEDQNTILRNDKASRSPLFTEFIHALGWTVPLTNHLGYTGGLDSLNRTTGEYTPYYANHAFEVIFHDITSMPTEETDDQQILKKRHVGNDIVHIVYSEHVRDYHPATITSHFNDAHIVVYPLTNGLFRIQVFRKPGLNLFGPLLDGMVVRKELLGQLVRQTAMNANRYVRYNTQGYEPPYPTRHRYLNDLAQRFCLEPDLPALLTEVVNPLGHASSIPLGSSSDSLPSALTAT